MSFIFMSPKQYNEYISESSNIIIQREIPSQELMKAESKIKDLKNQLEQQKIMNPVSVNMIATISDLSKKLEVAVKALQEIEFITDINFDRSDGRNLPDIYKLSFTALKEITNVGENGKRMTGEPDKELPTDYRPNGNW